MSAPPMYSDEWIATFLHTIPPEQTAREVEYLQTVLPLFTHARVLDVCCGEGRHARPLALAGYAVTGIDANEALLERARVRWREDDAPGIGADDGADPRAPVFRTLDMRSLAAMDAPFDAVTCMWSSFGFFDATTNDDVLARMAAVLRPGGRIVLDIYNRDFFERHTGSRRFERAGRTVTEEKTVVDGVLTVRLDYGDGVRDTFTWQIFAPEEIGTLAKKHGLATRHGCTGFDPERPIAPAEPRMQWLLERS